MSETPNIELEHPRCPYCHTDVLPGREETKQSCGVCMAWHHAECWSEHGGCSACNTRDSESTRVPAGSEPAKPGPAKPGPAKPGASPARWGVAIAAVALLTVGLGVAWAAWPAAAPTAPLAPGERPEWQRDLELADSEEARTAAVRRGAEAGNAGAMNQLGFRLVSGLGCEADPEEGARWGMRAAEAGHAEAMYGLGLLYETGRGVPRDEAQAVSWYRRAAGAGDTLAGPRLDALLRRRPDLR